MILSKQLITIVNSLNYEQIHELNHILIRKLKEADARNVEKEIRKFRIFDVVSFVNNGKKCEGIINRINQKTVSVLIDNTMWKVPPSLLTRSAKKNLLDELKEIK